MDRPYMYAAWMPTNALTPYGMMDYSTNSLERSQNCPELHWIFLYKWYRASKAKVRWAGELSKTFSISKGMRQGSILSPRLFSVFIDDLLQQLKSNTSTAA